MKKRLIIIATVMVCVIASALTTVQMYTKEQVTNIAVRNARAVVSNIVFNEGKPEPIWLGKLITVNYGLHHIYTLEEFDKSDQVYQKGWRKIVAENPTVVFSALNLYSIQFKEDFDTELLKQMNELKKPESSWRTNSRWYWENSTSRSIEKWPQDSTVISNNIDAFVLNQYWVDQRNVMDVHQKLIDQLLLLSDEKLDAYFASIELIHNREINDLTPQQKKDSTEVAQWYSQKKLYKINGEERYMGDLQRYPSDYLLLACRMHKDFPKQWTYRKYLQQTQRFSVLVESDFFN